jgi:hypothetical protein
MDSIFSSVFPLLCGWIFVLVFGGIGILVIVLSIRSRKKAEVSLAWPSVSGKVLKAEVEQGESIADEDGMTRTIYYPSVEYEYEVGGQVFTGKKISFGATQTYSSNAKAAAELAQYPLGKPVPVYYDPADPGQAVLVRKAKGSTLGMIVGIIFLLLSLCIVCPLSVSTITSILSIR